VSGPAKRPEELDAGEVERLLNTAFEASGYPRIVHKARIRTVRVRGGEVAAAWCGCGWTRVSAGAEAMVNLAAGHVIDASPAHVAQQGFDAAGMFWVEERDFTFDAAEAILIAEDEPTIV
jgi:hypothetical protein